MLRLSKFFLARRKVGPSNRKRAEWTVPPLRRTDEASPRPPEQSVYQFSTQTGGPSRRETEIHAFAALKDRLGQASAGQDSVEPLKPNEQNASSNTLSSVSLDAPQETSVRDHTGDPEVNKALIFRNILIDRIASENLYDVVKKNPTTYFNKAPFIDPNEGFRRTDLLKKLQRSDFNLEKLSPNDLKRAFKLNMIDIEDFMWKEVSDDKVTSSQSKVGESIESNRPNSGEDIPWELMAMHNEFQAMLRGDPSLDAAESILKGKHVTDPREFTEEDLQRIKEWDKSFQEREVLECALQTQPKILGVDNRIDESYRIMQNAKRYVLEDAEYQASVSEVQLESQNKWENFVETKTARPWKAQAADRIPFFGDTSSRVPKYGDFNITPVNEEKKAMGQSEWKKRHYTHHRVLKGREVKNSGRFSLTKNFS